MYIVIAATTTSRSSFRSANNFLVNQENPTAVSHDATTPVRVGPILASALPRRALPGDGGSGSGAAAGSTAGSSGCNSITSACCAAAESDAFKVGNLRVWKPDPPIPAAASAF